MTAPLFYWGNWMTYGKVFGKFRYALGMIFKVLWFPCLVFSYLSIKHKCFEKGKLNAFFFHWICLLIRPLWGFVRFVCLGWIYRIYATIVLYILRRHLWWYILGFLLIVWLVKESYKSMKDAK